MRILPVLDLMGGKVVHGVGGVRSQYRPITSQVTDSYLPVRVAGDLKRLFGFSEIYIADLDSIQDGGDHSSEIAAVHGLGYRIYLDPGIGDSKDLGTGVADADRIVIGTETLRSLSELEKICKIHPFVVVSIDFKGELLLSADRSLEAIGIKDLVKKICLAGASEIIYLDLKRVGRSSGTASQRLEEVLASSSVPVLVGGGIRNAGDIANLSELGADGVLVATCIHNGNLPVEDVKKIVRRRGSSRHQV